MNANPSTEDALRANLLWLKERGGLSVPEVARRADIDKSTIYLYLRGLRIPRADVVDQIARVYGLEAWLLYAPSMPALIASGKAKLAARLLDQLGQVSEEAAAYIVSIAEREKKNTR